MTWLRRFRGVIFWTYVALTPLTIKAAQQSDGRIIFGAAEAEVQGEGAKMVREGDRASIGSWAKDSAAMWNYKPTRWGMYDLHIAFTKGADRGGELEVEIGEKKFQVRIPAEALSRVQTPKVERFYLAKADPFTVTLRCKEAGGLPGFRVEGLELRPAPEGLQVVQEGEKINLHASNAITHSVMMRYEPATNKLCLGYWTNPKDTAEWKFTVTKAGSYGMQIWQGCGKGQGGSEVLVEVVGAKGKLKESKFVVEDTGHFQNFVPRDLGEVKFAEAGEYSLWVRPQNKKAAAVLDVRQIVLASVKDAKGSGAAIDSGSKKTVRLARFDIDATPPVGSFMAYDPVTNKWDLGLRARGIVLMGADAPIVLCAVDWIGIANESHDAFRKALAEAAGTSPERVAVHALHQHDAPDSDFSAEKILEDAGMEARQFEGAFQREVLTNLASAVRKSLAQAQTVTHLGLGAAKVEKVASNRRIFGPGGKVRATRYTACADPGLRDEPEGVIDPELSLVSFWNGDKPVAVLSYYATHPQSYYRLGIANPDFPGVARFFRQLREPAALHIHFNGAGGNIGAGKYNDGAHSNRLVLAERVADGMRRAWEETKREPIEASSIGWEIQRVALEPSKHLVLDALEAEVAARDPRLTLEGRASRMAFLRRCEAGHKLEIGCLKIGRARILHMPGELFVEYQLAAKSERPDLFVAMAAYGDYGPWYIGTAQAYEEGGYETQPRSSNVGPSAEAVLMAAMRALLKN